MTVEKVVTAVPGPSPAELADMQKKKTPAVFSKRVLIGLGVTAVAVFAGGNSLVGRGVAATTAAYTGYALAATRYALGYAGDPTDLAVQKEPKP